MFGGDTAAGSRRFEYESDFTRMLKLGRAVTIVVARHTVSLAFVALGSSLVALCLEA